MEQLFEAFGIDWRLIIAQAINFGVLLFALRYLLYTPVMKVLDKRRTVVAQGVEDAENAGILLSSADDIARATTLSAETEAQQIVARAREEAGSERERIISEAEARAEAIAREAELRSKEAASKLLRESEKEIARLIVLATEKAIRAKS